jgi:ligand-binding sensor domain-containing protein/two-component sensor histidine kinase
MKRLLAIFYLLWLSQEILANSNPFFSHLGVKDGLASNHVLSLWQDKKGFMWIGTSNGLQRYDGNSFMYFSIKKPEILPAMPVKLITEDKEGNMWMNYGSHYGIFNPADQSFREIPFEKDENRSRGEIFFQDSQGNIFIILVRQKILWYDQSKGIFTDQELPLRLPENYRVNRLFEDTKTGFYWIACEEGMAVYDPKRDQLSYRGHNPISYPFIDQEDYKIVTSYHIDKDRKHWISYWSPFDQLFASYDENQGAYTDDAASLIHKNLDYREIRHTLESKRDELWKYGVNGLYKFDREGKKFDLFRFEFFKYSEIFQVYEDREGALWMATDEGLYHFTHTSPEVDYYFAPKRDISYTFNAVQEIFLPTQKQTQFWIADWGTGIHILDENLMTLPSDPIYLAPAPEIEIRQTWTICQDKLTGKVWVGNQAGWLQWIDPETLETHTYNFPIFGKSTIRSIVQDGEGNIWFSTQKGDLLKYKKGSPLHNDSFEKVRAFNGYTFINMVDSKDRLWVGSSHDGAYCLDLATGEVLLHLGKSVFRNSALTKMAQLNDSIFFFGHELLHTFNEKSGEIRTLSYSEGLVSNGINAIVPDSDAFLWVCTPNGICRYNYFQHSFTKYGEKDGFGQVELEGTSGIKCANGNILYLGYNSMVRFNPLQFNHSLKPERPTLSSIKLFDQAIFVDSLTTEKKRTFRHDQNAFTFNFSTLNYTYQDKLKYFHRLSGIDQDWRGSGSGNMAVYSLLPPGDYLLEFKSENEERVSSAIGTFYFRVTPPFYETWWFRLLLGMVGIGIVYTFFRLNLNRILAVMKVRNRVARDLHDDMGSTLSTINILSSMAKTKLHTDPVKTSEYLSKISENSQRMMEAMDDIVWSIKPQNDSMEKVLARMREFANSVLEAKDIDFKFEVEDKIYQVKIPMETRRDLFLIYKEAVNNLAKYAQCNRAFIQFSIKKKKLQMLVQDYGKGFNLKEADEGNGLNNMQKRAEKMGGNLIICSNLGEGTQVILNIPLH